MKLKFKDTLVEAEDDGKSTVTPKGLNQKQLKGNWILKDKINEKAEEIKKAFISDVQSSGYKPSVPNNSLFKINGPYDYLAKVKIAYEEQPALKFIYKVEIFDYKLKNLYTSTAEDSEVFLKQTFPEIGEVLGDYLLRYSASKIKENYILEYADGKIKSMFTNLATKIGAKIQKDKMNKEAFDALHDTLDKELQNILKKIMDDFDKDGKCEAYVRSEQNNNYLQFYIMTPFMIKADLTNNLIITKISTPFGSWEPKLFKPQETWNLFIDKVGSKLGINFKNTSAVVNEFKEQEPGEKKSSEETKNNTEEPDNENEAENSSETPEKATIKIDDYSKSIKTKLSPNVSKILFGESLIESRASKTPGGYKKWKQAFSAASSEDFIPLTQLFIYQETGGKVSNLNSRLLTGLASCIVHKGADPEFNFDLQGFLHYLDLHGYAEPASWFFDLIGGDGGYTIRLSDKEVNKLGTTLQQALNDTASLIYLDKFWNITDKKEQAGIFRAWNQGNLSLSSLTKYLLNPKNKNNITKILSKIGSNGSENIDAAQFKKQLFFDGNDFRPLRELDVLLQMLNISRESDFEDDSSKKKNLNDEEKKSIKKAISKEVKQSKSVEEFMRRLLNALKEAETSMSKLYSTDDNKKMLTSLNDLFKEDTNG